LTQNHVLTDALEVVSFRECRSLEELLKTFLKRAAHERTCLGAVDAVPCDCHQASARHSVAQKSKVTIVNISIICLKDFLQLLEKSQPHCFNTKNIIDLVDTIRSCSTRINTIKSKSGTKICTFRINADDLFIIKLSSLWINPSDLWFIQKHHLNPRNSSNANAVQQTGNSFFQCFKFIISFIHRMHSNNWNSTKWTHINYHFI